MCGIVGVLCKTDRRDFKTGAAAVRMLDSLCLRGPDSTGVALLHGASDDLLYVQANCEQPESGGAILAYLRERADVAAATNHGEYVRASIRFREGARPLVDELEALVNELEALGDDVTVAGIGSRIEVLKYMGMAENLEREFHVSGYDGPAVLGHTRMATESKVDISHSQPLSPRGIPDLSIVHNGHITNYVKLRKTFENKGYTFATGNDSETIAVYLADKLHQGATLREAMSDSIRELDGSFTYLAMTPSEVGLAREPFGLKPMFIAETDDFVAMASESRAIATGFGRELKTKEPRAEEVLVWEL